MKEFIFFFFMSLSMSIGAGSLNLINDENLKKCIEDKIRIERTSYDKITFLNCSSRQIYQLEGIEVLRSLKSVDFGNNFILDFSPLKKLNHLEYLDASMNFRVKSKTRLCDKSDKKCERWNAENTKTFLNLKSILELRELKGLALCGTFLKDISGIEKLENLESLFLHTLNIKDLSDLKKLKKLKTLSVTKGSIIPQHLKIKVWNIENNSSKSDLNISEYLNKKTVNSPYYSEYIGFDSGGAGLIRIYETLLTEMGLKPLVKRDIVRFLAVDAPKTINAHPPLEEKEKPFEKFSGFELQKTGDVPILKCFGNKSKIIKIKESKYSNIKKDLSMLREKLRKNKGASYLSDDRVVFIEEIDSEYIGESFACTDDLKLCYEETNAFVENVCQNSIGQ
jgi:hypothetical protein